MALDTDDRLSEKIERKLVTGEIDVDKTVWSCFQKHHNPGKKEMSSDDSEVGGGSAKVDTTEIDDVKPFEEKGKMKGEKTSKAVKKGMSKLKVKRNTEDEKTVLPADMEADALPEKVEEKKTDMEIGKERPGVVGYEKYLTETGSKLASDQSKETSEAKSLTKEENYEVLEKQKIENREAAEDEAAESGDEGILEEGREAKPQGSQSPADKQSENDVRLRKETASDEGLLICRQYQMAKLPERKVWLMWNAGQSCQKRLRSAGRLKRSFHLPG